jgi:hypothetical protein
MRQVMPTNTPLSPPLTSIFGIARGIIRWSA